MEGKDNKQSYFSEAIQVLLITSVGYFAAYIHELSYLRYFGIPRDFIEIETKTIIISAISISFAFMITFQIIYIIDNIIKMASPDGNIAKLFERYGLAIIPTVTLVLLSDISIYMKVYLILVPFPIFWLHIIEPFFKRKKFGSYKAAQSAIIESSKANDDKENKSETSDKIVFFIAMVFFTMMASSVFANRTASGKSDFYINKDTHEVLIRSYGDNAIFASIKDNQLTGEFTIREIKEIKLELKEIDNIKPEDSKKIGTGYDLHEIFSSLFTSESSKSE